MSDNRNAVSRFEDAMQRVIEGTFGKLFRTRLQPVELARKLERAMDENLIVSAGRRVAPNVYTLYISESDYQRFEQYMRTLINQMQQGLIDVAKRRNYSLTTRPFVTLKQDNRMATGEARAEAKLLDASQLNALIAAQAPVPNTQQTTSPNLGGGASPDSTVALPPPVATLNEPAEAPNIPTAALILRTPQGPGQTYPINREIVHIGRHTTNDIVVNDRRVSRYHAEIRYERGQFIMYDLASLNGISINGTMNRQAILHNGDILIFGSYSFIFERR